jgi:amino acid transporter
MQLKPILGPIQLIFYSVGVIVGAGVYSVLGAAAGLAQHHLWISFLVSAGGELLTAISYAEMATAFPAAGAEYVLAIASIVMLLVTSNGRFTLPASSHSRQAHWHSWPVG